MRAMLQPYLLLLATIFLFTFNAQAATNQEIQLELNKVEPSDRNCILTFVVSNGFPAPLEKLAFEFVVFDAEYKVDRLTVFDFKTIDSGKFRVRQFQLPDTNCDQLGRLLINGVSSCEGKEISPANCSDGLRISNKTKLEFLN